jgi:hypothetical protein
VRPDRVDLRHLAVEFLLIVAGVLSALMVDAAWQSHLDRDREREYLRQLRADAVENRARLMAAHDLEDDQRRRARAMVAALRTRQPLDPDSAAAWMDVGSGQSFPWYSDPRLATGTMVALVETGDLNLIRDPGTRSATIAYLGQLQADLAEFGRSVDPFQEHYLRLVGMSESHRGSAGPGVDPDSPGGILLTVQGDQEATVLFQLFAANIGVRMWYLEQMRQATDSFLVALGEAP